jgi:hypothetical protein
MKSHTPAIVRSGIVIALAAFFIGTISCRDMIKGESNMPDDTDGGGSVIGAVKMEPKSTFIEVPELLEKYIKVNDELAWGEVKEKINYTYRSLSHAIWPVLRKDNLKAKIIAEIRSGKKLFFKPNLVNPRSFDFIGDGTPGSKTGTFGCTDWAFLAALMRFFHDDLNIRYYQMAIGDAGVSMPNYSQFLKCTPEALIEGTPYGADANFWAGWAFYFVRKYLSEATTPHDSRDDPLNGYMDSIAGEYVTPGQATTQGKLMVYDLNNAEWFDRGRRVDIPDGGDNYKDGVVVHKAVVGDPNDLSNYPGSVLVNAPILRVHSATMFTCAIKNLGMGGWPMTAGDDSNSKTTDWLYSCPPDSPPGLKTAYHDRWYVLEVNNEGMPIKITDTPNMGLDGTMVDMILALAGQVPYVLHVVSAVNVIDLEHFGTGSAARQEGLIFASTDPVAIDLLCGRFMFKNIPSGPLFPKEFARPVPIPRYDDNSGAIVTDGGVDERVLRCKLFDYAERRGLGIQNYYVEGKDLTSPVSSPLVSKNGHLGKIVDGRLVEVMTNVLYFHNGGSLWDLQPSVLAYAQATDQLTGSGYYEEFMELDEDEDGIIDDRERGRKGLSDCTVFPPGIGLSLVGKREVEHGMFFIFSRLLKYSDPAWNVGNAECNRVFVDAMVFPAAWRMATDEKKGMIDPFFSVPYGSVDGTPRWPSLQFAKYELEKSLIHGFMYSNAAAYSQRTGKSFTLYVPNTVPYAPESPPGKQPWSYNPEKVPNVVELDPTDPDYSKLVFAADFGDETW